MTIPTREEWKKMVRDKGYHAACASLDCDLDDVPGIEETWIENFERLEADFREAAIEAMPDG